MKIDTQIKKYLEGITGVVEATSCEKYYLWKEYHQAIQHHRAKRRFEFYKATGIFPEN